MAAPTASTSRATDPRPAGAAHSHRLLGGNLRTSGGGCRLVRPVVPWNRPGRRLGARRLAGRFIVSLRFLTCGRARLVPSPRTFGFALGATALAPVLDFRRRKGIAGKLLPVELDAWIHCLERSLDRLVERLASHPHTGRRSKPVQNARLRRPSIGDLEQVDVLVAALVARNSDEGHQLFSFLRSRRSLPWLGSRHRCGASRGALHALRLPPRGGRRPCRAASASGRLGVPAAVHEREPHLVADGMIAPDLADANLVILAKPARDIDHARRQYR